MKIIRRTAITETSALPDAMHPVLKRIYAARNIGSALELNYSLEHLHTTAAFGNGMTRAVELLAAALAANKRIVIVADFDADGATSCALALRALRLMGARDVCYVVPDRFKYGYGLTPEIVAVTAQLSPDLLITVDNGISSVEGVLAAKQNGMQVIITDHHLPGARLPEADAIVNPNQPGENFPSKSLAGVGVIFYVMLALRAHLRATHWFQERNIPDPNLAQLLDLVALGTVADVVTLDGNNRILVAQGLQRIRSERSNAGIRALLAVAGRQPERIGASDLAFAVAPRLNAAGRLEDMALGIECLLCDDYAAALGMAQRLDELNRERRAIESDMQEQALSALAAMQLDDESALPYGLCLFDPAWHQGVIGILAARIKERTHRPVIAFAASSEVAPGVLPPATLAHPCAAQEIKGSARSVPGVHIRDVLDSIAARHPGLLSKFGGHAMAAGLTLKRTQLDDFSRAFDLEVRRHLAPEQMQRIILSDGELDADAMDVALAQTLRDAGPWGQGFPEPVFDGEFEILKQRRVGEKHLKLTVRHPQGGPALDAIAFNIAADDLSRLEGVSLAHLVYKLDINDYRGVRSAQLVIEHISEAGLPQSATG